MPLYGRRTDMAAEARELYKEKLPDKGEPDGVVPKEYEREGFSVTSVEIINENGAKAIDKPMGRYVTVELEGLIKKEERAFERACKALEDEIKALLPEDKKAPTLVAGLGNRAVTPDALGPWTAEGVISTRHVIARMPEYFGDMRPVSVMTPGVLGTTGIETPEILLSVAKKVGPQVVIVIDALASRRTDRLCRSVQLCDTGLAPGSGVGGDSAAIDSKTFGIPVIAIGAPTVVDSRTLAMDTLEEAGIDAPPEKLEAVHGGMFVTPKDVDARLRQLAKIISLAINRALHDGISNEDMEAFLA